MNHQLSRTVAMLVRDGLGVFFPVAAVTVHRAM